MVQLRGVQLVMLPTNQVFPLRRAIVMYSAILPSRAMVSSKVVGTLAMKSVHSYSFMYLLGLSASICKGASKTVYIAIWCTRVP